MTSVLNSRTNDTSFISGSSSIDAVATSLIDGTLDVKAETLILESTTQSIDSSSGSLITYGGIGVAKDIRCGGTIYGKLNGTISITTLTLSGTTQSTNTSTGTLIVCGGVGIAKDAQIGGLLQTKDICVTGNMSFPYVPWTMKELTIGNTVESTSTDSGCLILNGGCGMPKSLTVGGTVATTKLTISDTIASTSSSTGCLVLHGGLGVEKQIHSNDTYILDNSNADLSIRSLLHPVVPSTRSLPTYAGSTYNATDYATLITALGSAIDGDIVSLAAGTYDASGSTITISKAIKLVGVGDTTIIQNTTADVNTLIISSNNVLIQSLKIINSFSTGASGCLALSSTYNNIYIDQVTFDNRKYGILASVDYFQCTNCTFNTNGSGTHYCFVLYKTIGQTIIANNTFVPDSGLSMRFVFFDSGTHTNGSVVVKNNVSSGTNALSQFIFDQSGSTTNDNFKYILDSNTVSYVGTSYGHLLLYGSTSGLGISEVSITNDTMPRADKGILSFAGASGTISVPSKINIYGNTVTVFGVIRSSYTDATKDKCGLIGYETAYYTNPNIKLGWLDNQYAINTINATHQTLLLNSSLASTDTSSGCLVIKGGFGLAQDLYMNGKLNIGTAVLTKPASGSSTFTFPISNGSASQYLQTDGLGVTSWQTVNTTSAATFNVSNTDNSSSTSTGVLTIAGGAGVAKSLYASLFATQSGHMSYSETEYRTIFTTVGSLEVDLLTIKDNSQSSYWFGIINKSSSSNCNFFPIATTGNLIFQISSNAIQVESIGAPAGWGLEFSYLRLL